MTLLPLFLHLAGRRVVVVGAGPVAEKKIEDLVACGATVEVIARSATPRVRALPVALRERAYREGDLEGAWLAVSATGDPEVGRAMRAEAEGKRVWLLAVDDLAHTALYSAAVIRREPLVVAISSTGEAPALVRLMREVLERALPSESWVEAARALRTKWKRERTPHHERFSELARLALGG